MDGDIRFQIREIAQNAIQEISRITQIVNRSNTQSSGRTVVNTSTARECSELSTQSSTHDTSVPSSSPDESSPSTSSLNQFTFNRSSSNTSFSPSNAQPRSNTSMVRELQRRFPSSHVVRSRLTNSSRNRASATTVVPSTTRGAGRPLKESSIKDIVIVGYQVEKTPTTRNEKIKLERKNRVITGFSIDKRWNEKTLYNRVKAQFPDDCKYTEYEFVKNVHGVLVQPKLATGVKIDASILLKSIASSGVVYVRLLAEDSDSEDEQSLVPNTDTEMEENFALNQVRPAFSYSSCDSPVITDDVQLPSAIEIDSENELPAANNTRHQQQDRDDNNQIQLVQDEDSTIQPGQQRGGSNIKITIPVDDDLSVINEITDGIIDQCKEMQNPVDILRKAQEHILTGRKLEITDPTIELEGETSFVLIDRDNLYEHALTEVSEIKNLRHPLQVSFIGEEAHDFGGPRKEFFRLVLAEIKERLFDNGLMENLVVEYYLSGIIMGLSVLQNGNIPTFLSEYLEDLLDNTSEKSVCISNLRKGLLKVGVYQLMSRLPLFVYLFRPSSSKAISVAKLIHLIHPNFSEEGTNARKHQKSVYAVFYKYLKQVESNRRVCGETRLTLNHILQFVCGTDEEPVLGFGLSPEIRFVESTGHFCPFANTCTNSLTLPAPTNTQTLPPEDFLFNTYDHAFSSAYFGRI